MKKDNIKKIKELLEDIKEAEKQGKFTYEDENWLFKFRKKIEDFIAEEDIKNDGGPTKSSSGRAA